MEVVTVDTLIVAPLARCFDAARDLDLHARSMAHTGERAVAALMRDVLRFSAPLGILGRIAERLLLRRYMTRGRLENRPTCVAAVQSPP